MERRCKATQALRAPASVSLNAGRWVEPLVVRRALSNGPQGRGNQRDAPASRSPREETEGALLSVPTATSVAHFRLAAGWGEPTSGVGL